MPPSQIAQIQRIAKKPLEEVFAEASIPVNEAADIKDQDEFRRFLSDVKPADLIRHLKENNQINENPFDLPDTENNKQN